MRGPLVWSDVAERSIAIVLVPLMAAAMGCSSDADDVGRLSDATLGRDASLRFDAASTDGGIPSSFSAVFTWNPITFASAVDHGHVARPVPEAERIESGAVRLREVALEAGLADAIAGGNQHGVGVGFIDVDGDGFEDIFIANGLRGERIPSQLWLNDGDGTFTDATRESGVRAVLEGRDTYSVAAADYDADGDLDLYVGTHPRDVLLKNDGTGRFADATAAAGAGGPPSSERRAADGRSKIASWGDFDGDGWLDVVVASNAFESQDARLYLLKNLGDGTFRDVTEATRAAASPTGNPCAVFWSDYDNDGDQDLWVWNDRGDNQLNRVLLQNDPGPTFVDVRASADLSNPVGHPMGIDAADINRDGFLDYYVSNIGNNPLYLGGADGVFVNITRRAGTEGTYGWGLGFEDFNADAWPDIFVAQEDNRPYLSFTHRRTLPPEFDEQAWPHANVNGRFAHNVAVAFADYDHDGAVDVVTGTTDGSRINLYRNETPFGTNRWLEVRIPETPRTGEKGGVSARVVVKTGGVVQFRDINGGSSRASQNATSVRFGLGQWTGAEWVAAIWPDGRELSAINVEGNRTLELR